ncbi:MAG: glutamate formiminotransferase [Patulibacter sp.]|nr:glutamate formiminotransferase [Patulibacter sp.]
MARPADETDAALPADDVGVASEIPTDASDPRLLIAVPNVSEGRNRAAVQAIGAAYVAGGARLLDTHVDPDHHRAVHTLAGVPGALGPALAAGAEETIRQIDLRTPRGIHPHVGALDVCPVVYLDPAREGAAVLEALIAAERIGRLGVPVLLYGALGDGRTRAELRRGGPAGLAERLLSGELRPDFGPARIHDRAGAALVGVRPPLLAFNVELAAPATVEDARRIAAVIREGGSEGLPGVRAIGLQLDHDDGLAATVGAPVAQVSCNVEDHRAVPLARLVAAVAHHADVAACEVIGLPPAAAFEGFPDDLMVRGRRTLEDALVART